jgi:hypothetical protein
LDLPKVDIILKERTMEHEKRIAKALGINDYKEGGRTHKCILRICADVPLESSDEQIIQTTKMLPLLLRRAIETARRSCEEADAGVLVEDVDDSSESDSDSGSSSSSDENLSSSEEEEEEKNLEGGSKGWHWKSKKAVQSKAAALKSQIESFYTGRINSELHDAHSRAHEYISKHPSEHLQRAQHALKKEKDNLEERIREGWSPFHSKAEEEMQRLHDKMISETADVELKGGEDSWKKPLFDGLRAIRTSALNSTHEYVNENAPKWKSEMMGHGERALGILKSI